MADNIFNCITDKKADDGLVEKYRVYYNLESLVKRVLIEDLSDQGDGTKTIFDIANKPMVDKRDATATTADVTVLVDDVPVTVTAIDPNPAGSATVTLSTAPGASAVIKISYKYRDAGVVKRDQIEIVVEAVGMIDSTDEAEAKTLANTAATERKNQWYDEADAKLDRTESAALNGNVTL